MSLKFLCAECHEWFEKHPQAIPQRCFDAYEVARFHYHSNDFDEALIRIGCAFEMAEIMMKKKFLSSDFSSDWLIATSGALIRVLTKMNMSQESIEIYQRTDKLLIQGIGSGAEKRLTPKLAKLAREAYGARGGHLTLVHSQKGDVLH